MIEDNRHVTVTLNGHRDDDDVTANAWTATVPPADFTHALMPDGSYTVTAAVSDAAGNPATPATQAITVDETAPTIAITTPIAGDNVVSASEAAAGFAISGTTSGVEDGRHVTVTLNGHSYDAVVTANAWPPTSTPFPYTPPFRPDGSYTVTAAVSDAAGNPATPATQAITVDE